MATTKREPKTPIELQIQRVIEAFNRYKKSTEAVNKTIGKTNAKGSGKFFKLLWKKLKSLLNGVDEKLIATLKDTSLLAAIDLCSLLNTRNNIKDRQARGFNPNQTPPPDDIEWRVKKLAYDTQIAIDLFQISYQSAARPGAALMGIISEISPNISRLSSSAYLGSKDLRGKFPQIDKFTNYLADQATSLATVGAIADGDKEKQKKFLEVLQKIRKVCVFVQSTTVFAELVGKVLETIDSLKVLDNVVDPDVIIKRLATRIKVCNDINNILSRIVKVLQDIRGVIKISLILVKIFKILLAFFALFPLPSLFTTVGIQNTIDRTTAKLDKYANDTINLLNEINILLALIIDTLDGVSEAVDLLINILTSIVEKIKSCDRSDDAEVNDRLEQEITNQINGLRKSNDSIKEFSSNYKNKKKDKDNTYNGYTISILKEQIFDAEIRKTVAARRYGVAIDGAGVVVVQSGLTFASDDSIIISEVKLLLAAKGLAKAQPSVYSQFELDVIGESENFLDSTETVMDDIDVGTATEFLDTATNEDDNDKLGLNSFINKQKGGKELRGRVRNIIEQVKQKLNFDVQQSKK